MVSSAHIPLPGSPGSHRPAWSGSFPEPLRSPHYAPTLPSTHHPFLSKPTLWLGVYFPTLHRYHLIHSFSIFQCPPHELLPFVHRVWVAYAFSAFGCCPFPLQPHSWLVTQILPVHRRHMETPGKDSRDGLEKSGVATYAWGQRCVHMQVMAARACLPPPQSQPVAAHHLLEHQRPIQNSPHLLLCLPSGPDTFHLVPDCLEPPSFPTNWLGGGWAPAPCAWGLSVQTTPPSTSHSCLTLSPYNRSRYIPDVQNV